jgi:nucleoside-diphosphate-sugar epimerase
MKVLITGANGFVGSHLIRSLSKGGKHKVTGLVRETSNLFRLQKGKYNLICASLDEPLLQVTKGFDAVIHAAANTTYWGNDELVYRTNVDGTVNLIKSSIQNGVTRFVHFSSTVVYGFSGNRKTAEDAPLSPFPTAYCLSKAASEERVYEFVKDIELIILRPSNIFGPLDNMFSYLLIWAVDRGILRAFPRGGITLTSPCYVKNIIHATNRALETKQGLGQAYNISDGSDMEWRTFLGIITGALGKRFSCFSLPVRPLLFLAHALERANRFFSITSRPFITPHDIAHVASDYSFSIERAKRLLGYRPQHTTEQGIEETVQWYREYRKGR